MIIIIGLWWKWNPFTTQKQEQQDNPPISASFLKETEDLKAKISTLQKQWDELKQISQKIKQAATSTPTSTVEIEKKTGSLGGTTPPQ